MPELIYSGFVGSWGYYNSSGTFVKTTSSGAPLSQPLPVSQSVVPSVWQPSQLAKQQQDFQKRVNDPRKPRSPEEARELYGTMQQDVYVLPGAPIGTEITKTTKTLGRQESYEEYAKEIAAGGGVYRGERQEDKPDILEIGAVVASDISRSFTGIGATEYTSAFETKYPRVETFGLSEKTQQWEERGQAKYSNVLESPQYKTTKVVGMLGFLSGGGGFGMADWGSEAIFIGNTMATGGKSRTAGTLRVSQEGFLGTRVTDYPVKFTQKGFKQGSSFFVEGLWLNRR